MSGLFLELSGLQTLRMPGDMLSHEGRDEIIAVVIARLHANSRLLPCPVTCLHKQMRLELLSKEIVGIALVDQQVWQARAVFSSGLRTWWSLILIAPSRL